jgi:hypothetical protein
MGNLERDLERFLRKELFAEREKHVTKLVLYHCPAGSKPNEVETFKVKEGMSVDELPAFIEEIVSRGQSDADGSGGVQRFVLRVFVQGDSAASGRMAFRLRGNDDDFDEAFDDAPNQKGLTTQLMRHNEAMARILATVVGSTTSSLTRQLEAANARAEDLQTQRYRDFDTMERLRSGQHERDMDMLRLESEETRKTAMFEKFAVLAPVLLNKLAGQKLLPSSDPSVLALKEVVSTLDSSQFENILKALRPEQAIALIDIIKSFQAADEKAKNGSAS